MTSQNNYDANANTGCYCCDNCDSSEHQFPPMSQVEKDIILEWAEGSHENLMPIMGMNRLIKIIFKKFIEQPESNPDKKMSIADKIYSFGFTKVDGSIFNNPFTEIATLTFVYKIAIKEGDTDVLEDIKNKNKFKELGNKLLSYLNFDFGFE